MDRKTIETRDAELIGTIRTIVAGKETRRSEARLIPGAVVYIASALIGAGLLIAVLMPPGASKHGAPPSAALPTPLKPAPKDVAIDTEPAPAAPLAVVPAASLDTVPAAETPPSESVVDAHPAVRIGELVTCRRVENRSAVDPTAVFSLARTPRPTVWMTAFADRPPLALTHVYRRNGAVYCRVPLRIDYPRTRTWSRVTLDPARHLGDWQVDVVDASGRVLNTVSFRAVP
ncbi:hypothetical protein JCM14469_28300 [Desulfatiferula olefinivorans]